jgi:multidrug efflux pump subunit AcrA (membrane-fusion protein)
MQRIRLRPFCLAAWLAVALPAGTLAADLGAVAAQPASAAAASAFDGVVEALRTTVVAAQVPGAIVQLDAKVGDRVAAGQVLVRIDARAAEQNAASRRTTSARPRWSGPSPSSRRPRPR